MKRTVVWFSCGCASAVASYLCRDVENLHIVYCDTGGEHPDNKRFLGDVERWLDKKINILKQDKYKDHFDVCKKERWINGPSGARCTTELKKVQRFKYQQADDIQVFGYVVNERNRADRFVASFPEVNAKFPLIENNLTKENCIGLIEKMGIKIPAMYLLGFKNNNCIGCVKGGMGYWNHIRKHFPESFNQMMKIEREIGSSCIKGTFLDELEADRGEQINEPDISCDFVCQSIIEKYKGGR